MTDQWFYAQDGRQVGPLAMQSLQMMAAGGELRRQDLVWREGLENWIEAGNVPELFPIQTSTTLNYERPRFENEFLYAGFWLRFAALLIDIVICVVAGAIVGGIIGVMIYSVTRSVNDLIDNFAALAGHVMAWLYFALMESSPWQATLGKRAVGLRVTDLQGEPITFARASGRHFGKYVSGFILYIGFMLAGWTPRKQALHDMFASTLVLRR